LNPARSERGQQTDQRVSPSRPLSAPKPESFESTTKQLSALLDPCPKTTLVAVPVDQYVVHCQWEIAPADLEAAKRALGVHDNEYWPALQFYDVTDTAQDETVRRPAFSVGIQLGAENWYVRSCSPDHPYRADLVLKGEDGRLAVVARSNVVETPPSAPSIYADEHWLPIRLSPRPLESAPAPPLPIDMSSEVRSQLTALYHEPDRARLESLSPFRLPSEGTEETPGEVPALDAIRETEQPGPPVQSSLPIDMREEVKTLLSRLYSGFEQEPPASSGGPLFLTESRSELAEPRGETVMSGDERVGCVPGTVFLETRPRATAADLTELNEMSFASGLSSSGP